MALSEAVAATGPAAGAAAPSPTGLDHAALENDGPKAFGDRMGTPQPDEAVLWKGRPQVGLLARSAFHARSAGVYMAALAVIAAALGKPVEAAVAAGLGVVLVALLYFLAWLSARSTLYIVTDTRVIMRIGMAIETRINVPLKQITAAHLRLRSGGHGDIAFELSGERLLGNILLWPHVRPWHYKMPQPMLRAIPEAAHVAQLIADARARYGAIETNLTEIKDAAPASGQTTVQPAATSPGRLVPVLGRTEPGLEGAPA
ncbi:MAG: photosynthetic complex putative assembly protein PuhB [Erythrobacter sp.]